MSVIPDGTNVTASIVSSNVRSSVPVSKSMVNISSFTLSSSPWYTFTGRAFVSGTSSTTFPNMSV